LLEHHQLHHYPPLSVDTSRLQSASIATLMQTSSVMRTSGLASTSRHTVNRSPFQKSPAPFALRQRNPSTVRAEANNTGGSKGGSITNSGKTEKPDSYEVAT